MTQDLGNGLGPTAVRERAIRGVAWTSMHKWSARAATLVTFVILARMLEPEDFGLVALAAVFIGIVSALADAGFASYLVQAPTVDQRTLSTAFWSVLAFSLVLAGALVVSAPAWAALLQAPELSPVLRWLSLGVLFTGLSSTQVALLKRRLAFKHLALRSLASVMLSCIVAATLALAGAGVWSLVAQSLVLSGTSAAILWVTARWRPSITYSREVGKEIARYGYKVAASQIVLSLRARGDDLVIGVVLGVTALGYWTIAMRIVLLLVDTGISVVSVVATPVFARLKGDPRRLAQAYVRAVSSSVALMTPVVLSIVILAPTLIPWVFGEDWNPSGDLVRIVTFVVLAAALIQFDRGLMLALNRPGTELALAVGLTLAGLLIVVAAAPMGLTAVAVAVVVRVLLSWPVRLVFSSRLLELDVRAYLRRIALLAVVAAASGLTSTAAYLLLLRWGPEAVVAFAVPIVATVVTVAAVRWLLPDLWRELRGILPRRFRRRRSPAPAVT